VSTCTMSCVASIDGPVAMVKFSTGQGSALSSFTVSYSTLTYPTCAETDCTSRCTKLNSYSKCQNSTSCSTAGSQSAVCSCIWTYNGQSSGLASAQPDYETNGNCVDLQISLNALVGTFVALSAGLLVSSIEDVQLSHDSEFRGRSTFALTKSNTSRCLNF
jgi:hypothetical protein